jgi:hypothetical protein
MGIEILTIWKGMLINMRKIKILSIIITVTIIFSTYVKALSEKIENEETNSITNTINENEPIEEPPAEENQTNVEPENNDYEPSYPSYNPPQYQEKKSENADLRVLKIENMEPEFSKDVTEYYLTVDLEIDKIDIEAYSDSEKASVDIQGNNDLQEGENKIEIVVTAEAGNQKTYYIYVTKIDNAKMANANLKTLEVENFSIYPDFKRNIYNYNLTINKDIKKLNITAKPENEKSKIEIMGNENLKEGDNFIKVIVTAEDGKTIKTYKINAYISLKDVQIKQEDKTPAIIILGILSVCIIVVAIFIVKQNKK